MSVNGQTDEQVLSWERKLLSADDLRRHLTGQRELRLLPRTIVTPLAADELRARGVRITWAEANINEPAAQPRETWAYAEETPTPAVLAAVQGLAREGITLLPLSAKAKHNGAWAREIADAIASSQRTGVAVFCSGPELICCVANKIAGVRAATVLNTAQAMRARRSLGANLVAIEMPGRTFFEVRQILRAVATPGACPAELAQTLKELDGNAHR